MNPERALLLERYGAAYGREGFSVLWTEGLEGDDAKRTLTRAWPERAQALPAVDGGAFAAGLFAHRGRTKNPAVTLRASGLLVVECDTPEGLARVVRLELPTTWTVRSSAPHRQHRYYRWPRGVDPAKVSFRFEPAGVIADREHYYLLPPALHPSGAMYSFLPGLGPDDLPIAELPEHSYRALLGLANADLALTGPGPVTPPVSGARRILDARDFDELDEALAANARFERARAYGRRVLATASERIAAAEPGTRHSTINKSAYIVGGLLAATGLEHEQAIAALETAAERLVAADETFGSAANRAQTARAITRGLAAGAAHPRPIPERAA